MWSRIFANGHRYFPLVSCLISLNSDVFCATKICRSAKWCVCINQQFSLMNKFYTIIYHRCPQQKFHNLKPNSLLAKEGALFQFRKYLPIPGGYICFGHWSANIIATAWQNLLILSYLCILRKQSVIRNYVLTVSSSDGSSFSLFYECRGN